MKKFKQFFSNVLIGVFAASFAFGAVGCNLIPSGGDGSTDSSSSSNIAATQTTITPTTVVYSDYEKWAPDFSIIRLTEGSGALYINKDPQYSYGGEGQSILFHPMGGYTSGKESKFIFPLKSDTFGFNYSDLTLMNKITFEFFNAEEEDKKVAVGLTPVISSIISNISTSIVWQTLPAKQWTSIEYKVDTGRLGMAYDIHNIAGFYVAFENIHSREEEDAPEIYMDNIVIHNYSAALPMAEGVQLGDMEILDFESVLQEDLLYVEGPTSCAPTLGIVKACDVGLTAPSGENIYKMQFNPGNAGSSAFTAVYVSEQALKGSIYGKLPQEEAKNLVLKIDIYNDTNMRQSMELDFYDAWIAWPRTMVMEPKTWTTFTFSMEYVVTYLPTTFAIRFVWPEKTGEPWTFYVDNIRFEWASEQAPGQYE